MPVALQKQPVGQGTGNMAALRRYGQKLRRGHGVHTDASAAQEVRRAGELTNVPAGQLQPTPLLMA